MQHQAGKSGPHEIGGLPGIVVINNVLLGDHMTCNRPLSLRVAVGVAAVVSIYLTYT